MSKNSLATSITLFIMALALLVFALLNGGKEPQNKTTTATLETIQKTVSPYEAKESMSKVLLTQNFKNSSVSHQPTDTFQKTIIITGTIVDGYLYVIADVNNKALTVYDDIYAKLIESGPNLYKEYGGHLIQDQSLDTPKADTQTELLFDLSSIKYKKSFTDSNKEVLSGNWLAVLNGTSSKKILSFSSTDRKGNIQEMSIYYKCLENTSCSIVAPQ